MNMIQFVEALDFALSVIRWVSFHLITALIGIALTRGWIARRWGLGIFVVMILNLVAFELIVIFGNTNIVYDYMINWFISVVSFFYTIDLFRFSLSLWKKRNEP